MKTQDVTEKPSDTRLNEGFASWCSETQEPAGVWRIKWLGYCKICMLSCWAFARNTNFSVDLQMIGMKNHPSWSHWLLEMAQHHISPFEVEWIWIHRILARLAPRTLELSILGFHSFHLFILVIRNHHNSCQVKTTWQIWSIQTSPCTRASALGGWKPCVLVLTIVTLHLESLSRLWLKPPSSCVCWVKC